MPRATEPQPYAHARSAWRRPAGFSLIELVVAVAIAAPVYQGYLNESRIDRTVQDIREMEPILNDRYLDSDPPATLAAAGINRAGPGGNPYRYLWLRDNPDSGVSGARRRDRSLNPINSDYDLYSIGADGLTAPQFAAGEAHDEVVRANDGDFVGLAKGH